MTDFHPLAELIDHTLLKPDAVRADLERLCSEAIEHGFYSVCVNGANVSLCKELLASASGGESSHKVKLCSVVGFPLGAMTSEIKFLETRRALNDGADEIDMVINLRALKDGNLKLVKDEVTEIALACHEEGAILKVIIETGLLSVEEKRIACDLVVRAEADFVKTSTGFSGSGATEADLKLMRKVVGEEFGVKASGGIRAANVWDMVKAAEPGKVRIGASSSVAIVKEASPNP